MKINKVNFENFDKKIVSIMVKSKRVRKSIDDALRVDSRTMLEIIN